MKPSLSSLFQAVALDKEIPPLLIGERANTTGSKKFREFLLSDDDEGCLSVLKAQERGGADILDLSVAYAGRNEKEDMVRLLKKAALRLSAPLMIDSTQPDVIEEALKNYPGRPIVNSVNLEKGEEPLKAVCRLVRRYGAAVVGLTIDEEGMALTAARKLAVAERIAAAAFECGLREEDLFFDPLTFTLASGDASYAESARETLAAVALIRERFPKSHTVLGISNVSFGLPPRARRVLNSVFLAEAVSRGLGAAIIDPSRVVPLAGIEEPVRRAALDLIENRRPDALALLTDLFVSAEQSDDSTAVAGLSPEERLRLAVIDGDKAALEGVMPEVLARFSAEEVLNRYLIGAMKEVGERFGKGEMLLPFVLQSAETLRCGVDFLKPHLSASAGCSRKPVTVLLATVAGDVHDIGKNLVGMILENNGFEVRDIGVKADVSRIMTAAKEFGADLIGLSGLLVKSALIMKENLRLFEEAGMRQPVLLGGAALSESFVKEECAPLYGGTVLYCDDAFATLRAAMEWRENGFLPRTAAAVCASAAVPAAPVEPGGAVAGGGEGSAPRMSERPFRAHPKAAVPFFGVRMVALDFPDFERRLARRALFDSRWKLGQVPEEAEVVYRRLRQCYAERLGARAVCGYFPCAADGNRLLVEGETSCVFGFPRTGRQQYALSDFFNTADEGGDVLAAAVVTLGDGWDRELERLRGAGKLTESFYLYGLLAETVEAAVDEIHCRVFAETGCGDRRRVRFSFGYPACPDLSLQKTLFSLLHPEQIGVTLSDSFMMMPEFSVSALMPLSPDACYY